MIVSRNLTSTLTYEQLAKMFKGLGWQFYAEKSYGFVWIKYVDGQQFSLVVHKRPRYQRMHIHINALDIDYRLLRFFIRANAYDSKLSAKRRVEKL